MAKNNEFSNKAAIIARRDIADSFSKIMRSDSLGRGILLNYSENSVRDADNALLSLASDTGELLARRMILEAANSEDPDVLAFASIRLYPDRTRVAKLDYSYKGELMQYVILYMLELMHRNLGGMWTVHKSFWSGERVGVEFAAAKVFVTEDSLLRAWKEKGGFFCGHYRVLRSQIRGAPLDEHLSADVPKKPPFL